MQFPRAITGFVTLVTISSSLCGCSAASGDYPNEKGSAQSQPSDSSEGGASSVTKGSFSKETAGSTTPGKPAGAEQAAPSKSFSLGAGGATAQPGNNSASEAMTPQPVLPEEHAKIRTELGQAMKDPGNELIAFPSSMPGVKEWRLYSAKDRSAISIQGWQSNSVSGEAKPVAKIVAHVKHGLFGATFLDGEAYAVEKTEQIPSTLTKEELFQTFRKDLLSEVGRLKTGGNPINSAGVKPQGFFNHASCIGALIAGLISIAEIVVLGPGILGGELVTAVLGPATGGASWLVGGVLLFVVATPIIATVWAGVQCFQDIQNEKPTM